ncbi:unnamed protein product [Ostreobium quekettii]|uniref:GUN4-like domain-containing protein n=1 Tax=Ostreobium quekettii TaxID=121088 RepID=A0A8S1IYM8_9CHLO|nr:unnamed protein product [Ostreobium quekettii]|eukprot:evm.model.scf_1155.3 EVM.evm.TU.scf_1155.3   scf_1155:40845-41654(-)
MAPAAHAGDPALGSLSAHLSSAQDGARRLMRASAGRRDGPRPAGRIPAPPARSKNRESGIMVAGAISEQDSVDVAVDGLLGPAPPGDVDAAENDGKVALEAVELASEAGQDYGELRDLLSAGEFQEAGGETRARLLALAGADAVSRGWVYWSEVKFIPNADMRTIDGLWRAASGGRFGYSAQKQVFAACQRRWTRFFVEVGWVDGESNKYVEWPGAFDYSLGAPAGHLPETNCLRGTQLLAALMEHPAFEGAGARSEAELQGGTLPDWM